MTDREHGPVSYFPAIEAKYGRAVAEWEQLLSKHIDAHPGIKHTQLVTWLKSEHGLGHGHANALVAHTVSRRGR